MKKLIVVVFGGLVSLNAFSQTAYFQIEHDSTNTDKVPLLKSAELDSIINFYFTGRYEELKMTTADLFESLGIADEKALKKNIYNVFIFDHNFKKIKKGVSYMIGEGIDNIYQNNIYKIPNGSRDLYEVIFYLDKYDVLTSFTFTKGEETFDADIKKFAESIVNPIAGVASVAIDNSELFDLRNKIFDSLTDRNKALTTPKGVDKSSLKPSFKNIELSIHQRKFLNVDSSIDELNPVEFNRAFTKLIELTTYKFKKQKVNFPSKIRGMNQSTMTIERSYLERGDDNAKPFTHVSTYSITGKKWVSFGFLTGAIFAFGNNGRKKEVFNDGTLSEENISVGLTMATVYLSLGGFYEKKDFKDYSRLTKTSLFAGVVATPEPGIGAGLSYDLAKKISFNLGSAILLISKDPETASPSLDSRIGFFGGFSVKI